MDHIGAKNIIADIASVAIDRCNFPGQHSLAENGGHSCFSMRVLTRTIYVRITKRDTLQLPLTAVETQTLFPVPSLMP